MSLQHSTTRSNDSSSIASSLSNDLFQSEVPRTTFDSNTASWTEETVGDWLVTVDYADSRETFIANGITGDLLLLSDNAMLKELDISSVGRRIKLLNLIRMLQGYSDTFVLSQEYSRLEVMVRERAKLSKDFAQLTNDHLQLKEKLKPVWRIVKEFDLYRVKAETSKALKRSDTANQSAVTDQTLPLKSPKSAHSFTAPTPIPSLKSSPDRQNREAVDPSVSLYPLLTDHKNAIEQTGTIRVSLDAAPDVYKLFKVSRSDTVTDILATALKKFMVAVSGTYLLCARYGNTEKYLGSNDCPFQLQTTLKTIPVFVIKHCTSPLKSRQSPTSPTQLSAKKDNTVVQQQQEKTGNVISVFVYKSKRDEECDLSIGDQFRVIKSENGWCLIAAQGDEEVSHWVPAGCLLELGDKRIDDIFCDEFHRVVGVAIGSWEATISSELGFMIGDRMVIVKRYREWCIGDLGGRRGWVPSALISINHDHQMLG